MNPQDFLKDAVDVLMVAWLFYRLFLIFSQTKAIRVLMGIMVLLVVALLARIFEFEALLGLIEPLTGNRFQIAIIALLFIFSDEIKDTFAGIVWNLSEQRVRTPHEQVVEQVSRACASMASTKTGALIAIARENPLDHWEEADSVKINANMSAQLLETIFSGKTPLHDGAVIVRGGRIVAAKCQLPQSKNPEITRHSVGMRHRAAFGLAEMSDAVVIIVSEERGWISIAHKGKYYPAIAAEDLSDRLRQFLGVNVKPLPWYHSSRLLANGGLKLLALVLAFGVWAEQESSFKLVDDVRVFEEVLEPEPHREAFQFLLTNDRTVVISPEFRLRRALAGSEPNVYEQYYPSMEYQLVGKNRDRLRLFLSYVNSWLQTREVPPEIAGEMRIVLPEKFRDKALRQSAEATCALEIDSSRFRLIKDKMSLEIDRLEVVDNLTVSFEGEPEKGYELRSDRKQRISLPGRALTLPRKFKQQLSSGLDPVKVVSIEGRRTFDQRVELDVPTELKRWNPDKASFAPQITLVLWSKDIERDVQAQTFTEAAQKEVEAQRDEARRRAQEVEAEWRKFEEKLKGTDWDKGLSLSSYRNHADQLPDLDRRLAKAKVDYEAVKALKATQLQNEAAALKALQEVGASSSLELERARAGKAICSVIEKLRGEIVSSLTAELGFATQRVRAIEKNLEVLFKARDSAREQRDALSKEAAPTLPTAVPFVLPSLIESKGPSEAAKKAPAEVIAKAAASKEKRGLFQQAVKTFERMYLAIRESEALDQEIRDLEAQVANAPAPIRLELRRDEKVLARETRELTQTRMMSFWKRLSQLLEDAGKAIEEETRLLMVVAREWPDDSFVQLEPLPFLLLYRDLELEVPQVLAARKLFRSTFMSSRDNGATLFKQEAQLASELWWSYQQRIQERVKAVTGILGRFAKAPVVESTLSLVSMRKDVRQMGEELSRLTTAAQQRRVRLAELGLTQSRLESTTAAISSATSSRQAILEQLQPLTRKVNEALAPGPELAPLAYNYAKLKTQVCRLDEALLLLDLQKNDLEGMRDLIEPIVKPLVASMEVRLQELDKQFPAPDEERVPELLNVRREFAPWLSRIDDLRAFDQVLGEVAQVSSGVVNLSAKAIAYLAPSVDAEVGFESFVKLEQRRDTGLANLRKLEGEIAELAAPGRLPSAETDVELRVKRYQLEKERRYQAFVDARFSRYMRWLEIAPFVRRMETLNSLLDGRQVKSAEREEIRRQYVELGASLSRRLADAAALRQRARELPATERGLVLRQAELVESYAEALRSLASELARVLRRVQS